MLAGDEKRIRALFCELALEDQSVAPRFEEVWQSAEVTASFSAVRGSKWPSLKFTFDRLLPQTVLNAPLSGRRLVVFTSVLIAAVLMSLALWIQSREPARELVTLPANTSTMVTASKEKSREVVSQDQSESYKPTVRRRTRPTPKDTIVQKAVAISSWQSPTATLMEFPADSVLKSVPQLNQSLKELQSFLPDKQSKEQNQ